jgi:hypothetical protein
MAAKPTPKRKSQLMAIGEQVWANRQQYVFSAITGLAARSDLTPEQIGTLAHQIADSAAAEEMRRKAPYYVNLY